MAEAGRIPAGTALSGPAGGVAAAVALGRIGAGSDLITFDMGGTSTDIALVQDGRPSLSAGRDVGGARIALPSLDIVTLGAGGGSIARIGKSGLLQVGPESAGADPGPACYGAGGIAATVTDANLVLGYLDPASFLGGRRRLDGAASHAALGRLGAALDLDAVAAAAGVHRLVNARMGDAVRVATVRRGVDPRRFALLAFGGAAGLHVSAVAAELGIARVVVPLQASVLSAWGMLNTDLRVELTRSLDGRGGVDLPALRAAFDAMESEGRARLRGFAGPVAIRLAADMRYGEQVFEVTVPLDGVAWTEEAIADAFHRQHEALFTYALRDQEVVVVNARVAVIGELPPLSARLPEQARGPAAPRTRRVHLDAWTEVPVRGFGELAADQVVAGPAVIESETTTILLRPGDRGRFDASGWLEIAVRPPR